MTSPSTSDDAAHSSLVGGSTAERRLNCPGSYQLEMKIPEAVRNKSSSYADEGSALHAAIEYVLRENILDLDELIGMTFGEEGKEYTLTRDQVENAIVPCMDFFDALDEELAEEGGLQLLLEAKCQMPGIPGAFGTSDVVARTDKRTVIIDWKFGAGVLVKAEYVVEETEIGSSTRVLPSGVTVNVRPNSQLMFYARAAKHTFPSMFGEGDDWPVDLYIVQPLAREATEIFSKASTTVKGLEEFRFRLIKAVAEAKGDSPSTKRGDWCRFAACKTICPHHTGPAIDLSKLGPALERAKKGKIEVDWALLYGDLLSLADLAELFTNEVRSQAHTFVEAGHDIPGWKLVDKRATEKYVDEAGAQRHAIGLGVAEEDTVETAVKSPAQLAIKMEPLVEGGTKKARMEEARRQLKEFTETKSSGTNLVHESAKGEPVLPTAKQLMNLSEKLAALTAR